MRTQGEPVSLITLFGANLPGRELLVVGLVIVVVVAIGWFLMSRRR